MTRGEGGGARATTNKSAERAKALAGWVLGSCSQPPETSNPTPTLISTETTTSESVIPQTRRADKLSSNQVTAAADPPASVSARVLAPAGDSQQAVSQIDR